MSLLKRPPKGLTGIIVVLWATAREELPDDWKCPVCGASKKAFRPLAGKET